MICLKLFFRSLTLAHFEVMFNRTIVYDPSLKKWVVKKTDGKLIRDRFVQSDRLALFLHPEWHSMTFFPIKAALEKAMDTLQDKEDVNEIDEKVQFLQGLHDLLENFKKEEEPSVAAMADFKRLIRDQCPASKEFIEVLIENSFSKNINWDLYNNDYKGKSSCFSGLMTTKDCIAFWSDPKSLSHTHIGETQVLQIRSIICRFLAMEKNQSSEERAFASMKKRITGRPKLNPSVLLHEHQIKQICSYPNFFDVLKYDDEEANDMVRKFSELEEMYEELSKEIEKDIGEVIESDDGNLSSEDEDEDEKGDEMQQYYKQILKDREACLSDDDESDTEASDSENEMNNEKSKP